jgi:hypothetical protein
MGPAYFPAVLGGLMAFLGLLVLIGSFTVQGPKMPTFSLKPLVMILAANLAYGYLMKPLGLVISTAVLVFIAALGGHEFRWKEALLLAAGLAGFAVGVFVYGLGLPFPLWPST